MDQEVTYLGMSHHYGSHHDYGLTCDFHVIQKTEPEDRWILFFCWKTWITVTVADIIAEPDSPIQDSRKDMLVIKLRDQRFLPEMKELARKFELKFGLDAEIIY